jgi:hypothetical protein
LDQSLRPLDISTLGKCEKSRDYRETTTLEDEADESNTMNEEDSKIDDEFWTKQAEKINSRINGLYKKTVGNQKDNYGQTTLNSFAFYSNNIK